MTGFACNEVKVIWTVGGFKGGVQFGDIRVIQVDLGMAVSAGLFCIQTHFSPLLKVAGNALQSLVYRALQVAAVVGPWLVAFSAQLGSIFYGYVCLGRRLHHCGTASISARQTTAHRNRKPPYLWTMLTWDQMDRAGLERGCDSLPYSQPHLLA